MIHIQWQQIETPHPRPRGGYARAKFKSKWGDTVRLLEGELAKLRAKNVMLLCDIPRGQIRNDGQPYSNARASSPGITLVMDTRHGSLRYDGNQYDHHEDNIRAIAKTLEALRAVDRWGATKGEQYAGWKSLPPSGAELAGQSAAAQGEWATVEDAARFLLETAGLGTGGSMVRQVVTQPNYRRDIHRTASQKAHPDKSGGSEQLQTRVNLAKSYIAQTIDP